MLLLHCEAVHSCLHCHVPIAKPCQPVHDCRVQQLEETHAAARQQVSEAEARASAAQTSNVQLYEKVPPLQCHSTACATTLPCHKCCAGQPSGEQLMQCTLLF